MNGNTPWRTTRGSRLLALAEGQNQWYKIRNQSDGPAVVSIYDEIGFFGVKASDLISELADISGPIHLHINSPGGEVNEGLAIYNCLMARDEVTVFVDGIAASIASVIAMAGDVIKIAPSAQMMVHNPFAGVIGDADDFRSMADQLDENRDNISRIYAARAGGTPEHWCSVMKATGWYRGQEAIDAGLADELVEQKAKGKAALVSMAPTSKFNLDLLYSPGKVAAHVAGGGSRIDAKNVAWQFDLSDIVQVKPGCEHDDTHKGANGRVCEVNGNALGVCFNEDEGVHRWYTDNELLLVEEQNQSANSGPPPMASVRGVRNAAAHSYVGDRDTHHEPMSGTHSHNHAAFGADDHDDGIHHHSHTHNGDAVHGHEHTMHSHSHEGYGDHPHRHAHDEGQERFGPHSHRHTHHGDPDHDGDDDTTAAGDTDQDYFAGPARNSLHGEERAVIMAHIDLHNSSYDDSPWDGGAAMSAAANSANPASALSAICAGKRSGDASTKEAHALPHHKSPGSAPNKAGVSAAIAALNGGRGGVKGLTNRDAALAHLKAHAKAWESEGSSSDAAPSPWIDVDDEELNTIMANLKGVQ